MKLLVVAAAFAAVVAAKCSSHVPIKVRLNPASVAIMDEPDYTLWTLKNEPSANFTTSGVTFGLSVPSGQSLKGHWYKYVYAKFAATLGERVIGEGMSSDAANQNVPLTLTIQGLAAGNHTLQSFHNGWDNMQTAATLAITVDGKTVATNLPQTVRVNNIFDAAHFYTTFSVNSTTQTVTVAYTPSGADGRAFINAFEIDTADIDTQVTFPVPSHTDEHFDADTSLTATWHAPKTVSSPKYNVYLGTSNSSLSIVSKEQTGTSAEFTDLNPESFWYWRVDVVDGSKVHTGRVWKFRLARLAFPGAEGYGRFARGGRGGRVVKVTSLEDSLEEGTLRWATTVATGPRTVIFDIGGVITLTSRLTIKDPYLTIAGQTAPGKGIAIQGWPMGLSGARDVIVRHMRVRPGQLSNQTVDGMGMQGSNYCIFDRNSMGWAMDEAFSSRSAQNITFQRNMISEPLNVAGHKNYPWGFGHGYSASISGDIGSFHHNLLAHAEGRSWSMAGGADNNGYFQGRLDMRNNVVFNWGYRTTEGGVMEANFVGNYYKPGPASEVHYDLMAQYEDGLPGTQQYYCEGNSMVGYFNETSYQYQEGGDAHSIVACWANVSIPQAGNYQHFFDRPFFESHVTTQKSTEAYKLVLSDSGAQSPVLDDHDARIVHETLTGTTTYVGSNSGKKGIIDAVADVGGLEDFPTTTRDAAWDANGDGIADWWDGSTGGEGFTPLEGYLNFMADPHFFVAPGGSVKIELAKLAVGFELNPAFTVTGASKGIVTLSGTTATYSAGGAGGIDYLEVTVKDDEGSTWTRTVGVAIFAGAS